MNDYVVSLQSLHARHDAFADGREQGDSTTAHEAILDRLADNQRLAEAVGWSGCALERDGGTGALHLMGLKPDDVDRSEVPDLARGDDDASTARQWPGRWLHWRAPSAIE